MRNVGRKALQVFCGPWPIRPLLLAGLFFIVNQYAAVRVAEVQRSSIGNVFLFGLPYVLALSGALLAATFIARQVQVRCDPEGRKRVVYLACIVLADALWSALRYALVRGDVADAVFFTIRDLAALLIVSALFGVVSDRLAQQVRRAEAALAVVELQREQLLVADERARREVARFLHDNVQADLVVLAMQLRAQARELPGEQGWRINSVVDEIDNVRLLDIRAASRRLNPDIESLGLLVTLRELASAYDPAMSVSVECPYELPGANPEFLLAVYRICEQALLNAASHGNASHCVVQVSPPRDGLLTMHVSNNGRAMSNGAPAGTGSAIIEAWVARFRGSWSVGSERDRTVLTASLSLAD